VAAQGGSAIGPMWRSATRVMAARACGCFKADGRRERYAEEGDNCGAFIGTVKLTLFGGPLS